MSISKQDENKFYFAFAIQYRTNPKFVEEFPTFKDYVKARKESIRLEQEEKKALADWENEQIITREQRKAIQEEYNDFLRVQLGKQTPEPNKNGPVASHRMLGGAKRVANKNASSAKSKSKSKPKPKPVRSK